MRITTGRWRFWAKSITPHRRRHQTGAARSAASRLPILSIPAGSVAWRAAERGDHERLRKLTAHSVAVLTREVPWLPRSRFLHVVSGAAGSQSSLASWRWWCFTRHRRCLPSPEGLSAVGPADAGAAPEPSRALLSDHQRDTRQLHRRPLGAFAANAARLDPGVIGFLCWGQRCATRVTGIFCGSPG